VEARLGGPFQSPYVERHPPLIVSLAANALSSPEDAQSKDRARLFEAAHLPHTLPALVFLGVDDRPDASSTSVPARADLMHPEGVPYFALDAGTEDWEIEGGEFGDARASGSAMSGWEAGVFALSRALIDWNVRNKVGVIRVADFLAPVRMTWAMADRIMQFCAACGSPTYSLWGGWKRSCLTGIEPVEGKECFSLKGLHNFAYPRTDSVSRRRRRRRRRFST
jgi:NAD+ diphosphatase